MTTRRVVARDVQLDRGLVTALELLQHNATEFGHKDLLMTSHVLLLTGKVLKLSARDKRPPASGFLLVGDSEPTFQ